MSILDTSDLRDVSFISNLLLQNLLLSSKLLKSPRPVRIVEEEQMDWHGDGDEDYYDDENSWEEGEDESDWDDDDCEGDSCDNYRYNSYDKDFGDDEEGRRGNEDDEGDCEDCWEERYDEDYDDDEGDDEDDADFEFEGAYRAGEDVASNQEQGIVLVYALKFPNVK